jgi:hypothetical protein
MERLPHLESFWKAGKRSRRLRLPGRQRIAHATAGCSAGSPEPTLPAEI